MGKPRRSRPAPPTSNLAIVRKLNYEATDELCHPALRTSLEISVDDVFGEVDHVVAGKLYLVRGSYACAATDITGLRLTGQGECQGVRADVACGDGSFEVTAEPQDVAEGMEKVLDLLAYDSNDSLVGIRMRIELLGEA